MIGLKDPGESNSASFNIIGTVESRLAVQDGQVTPLARANLLEKLQKGGGFSVRALAEGQALVAATKGMPQNAIIEGLSNDIRGRYEAQPGWRKVLANLLSPKRDVTPSDAWVQHVPNRPSEAVIADWKETITDGIHRLARTVNQGQIVRGFHAKTIFAEPGLLKIYANPAVPESARVGFLAPGATTHKVAVRGSNGQGCPFINDAAGDVRGLAVQGEGFSITATNQTNGQHVKKAEGFVDFAKAITRATAAGLSGLLNQARSALEIGKEFGVEAPVVLARLTRDTLIPPDSLATETFVGSIVRLGDHLAKVVWVPGPDTEPGTRGAGKAGKDDPDYLSKDAEARGSKKWIMCLQFFTNEKDTPLDDATRAWKSPLIRVGELSTKPAGDQAIRAKETVAIESMRFNPGDFDSGGTKFKEFEGKVLLDAMGNVRKELYDASADERGALTTEASRALIRNFALEGR